MACDNGRVRSCGVRASSLFSNNNNYYYASLICFFSQKTNSEAALQTSILWSGFPLCVLEKMESIEGFAATFLLYAAFNSRYCNSVHSLV